MKALPLFVQTSDAITSLCVNSFRRCQPSIRTHTWDFDNIPTNFIKIQEQQLALDRNWITTQKNTCDTQENTHQQTEKLKDPSKNSLEGA
jgi:hypothetical protein